jgi:hypothetical protein
LLFSGSQFGWSQELPEFRPRRVVDKQFRPITKPSLTSGAEAASLLRPEELVLGVVMDGEARAYPINMLTGPRREIINDRLGDRDIAATW